MGDGDWRVIATRALTGEFLSWDLPLTRPITSRELSGPGGVFGAVDHELLAATADDGRPLLEEWSTALYVEEAGAIRGGGIINRIATTGVTREIEAGGFSNYPVGIPYADNYLPPSPPDPADVFTHVWEYVQSFPDADLGVTVEAAATWMRLAGGGGAFVLRDFEYRDCGELLAQLAQATPFDYIEQHQWSSDHSRIETTIKTGFPRLGSKRFDLRFAEGENVESFGVLAPDTEQYANDVYVYGQGSGSAMIRSRAARRDGRLRRCAVVPLASQGGQKYVDQVARDELARRTLDVEVSDFTVIDHPNARISTIQPGDDVLFSGEVPWFGEIRTWLRVLSVEESGDTPGRATVKTRRSDSFTYASATSPTGEPVPLSL